MNQPPLRFRPPLPSRIPGRAGRAASVILSMTGGRFFPLVVAVVVIVAVIFHLPVDNIIFTTPVHGFSSSVFNTRLNALWRI
jgi:hypothetical protein